MALSNSTTLRPFDFDIAYVPGRVDYHYDVTVAGEVVASAMNYLAADEVVAEIQYAADQPTLADPAATRRYWCFVDGCSYEPRHMFGDNGLCCGHYLEYSGNVCSCADSPFNVPAAQAAQLGRRDHVVCKRVCILCDGNHPAELCPRIRLAPLTCGACGDGNHHIQQCPAVRAELFAPALQVRAVAA